MRRTALAAAILLVSLQSLFGGTIAKIGTLTTPRDYATTTLLPDGRVLVAGGTSTTVEVFDPQRATSATVAGQTTLPLTRHAATRLVDGRVLITGGGYRTDGRPSFGHYGDREVRTYEPAANALALRAQMAEERLSHRATLLRDGRVLISGGYYADLGGFHYWKNDVFHAEIFDPATNGVRTIASLTAGRVEHTATLLHDGRVLIAGGGPASAELFDPATETFTAIGDMNAARADHTATLLEDGRVLIVGGTELWDAPAAEIFDPHTQTFTAVSADIGLRRNHTATLLRNGMVLIAGGTDDVVVYDPETDAIIERLPLPGGALQNHDATLLWDGSVLIAGGRRDLTPSADVFRYKRTPLRPRAVR